MPEVLDSHSSPNDQPAREAWQRRQLHSFTTRELINLDVVTSRYLKDGNLKSANKIHRLFKLESWEKLPDLNHNRRLLYALPDLLGLVGNCELIVTP